jgi:single stranded DNA-binding protein
MFHKSDGTIAGNLARDVEVFHTQSGAKIYKTSICVNHSRKEGDSYREEPHFFSVKCFRESYGAMLERTGKGGHVVVQGTWKTENYADKDGKKHYNVVFIVDDILSCKPKNGSKERNEDTHFDNIPF